MRYALGLISLLLVLSTAADHRHVECRGCWLPAANPPPVNETVGVNIHFIDPQPGEVQMIADAGFRWIRTDFKWDITERERGRYDFSPYDRLSNALQPYGIRQLFILDYGNRLYTKDKSVRTEEARQAFARWAVAAAQHFAGRGVVWEVFNEPNIAVFWPPKPNVNEYASLALAVGRAFRASVPNEKLIGPATSGMDFSFLESCFKSGVLDYWLNVSVHPYRQASPETVAVDYSRLRDLIQRYGGAGGGDGTTQNEISIISGEWGYSSVWYGMTEDKQAAMLAREFLTNVGSGIPLSIWYDWRDDGIDPKEAEHHFGLVRNQFRSGQPAPYQPKPAYLAAKTFTSVLQGFRFQQRLNAGGFDDYVLVFEKDGQRRMVAWTTLTTPHRVTIPDLNGQFSITSMTGADAGIVSASQGALAIEISTTPIYLTPAN